jgi:hypothetical protein
MRIHKKFFKEKLFTGILISNLNLKKRLIKILERNFGKIDYDSPIMEFNYSSYYNNEMGTPINKFFVSFKELKSPDSLYKIKLRTNKIENLFRTDGNRKINLDPGIINQSHLILATTKDGSHRIPLKKGIFAEITLLYEKGTFRPVEWTYPDFQSTQYIEILNKIRNIYKIQKKSLKN